MDTLIDTYEVQTDGKEEEKIGIQKRKKQRDRDRERKRDRQTDRPVSYTHLDVYKRQV